MIYKILILLNHYIVLLQIINQIYFKMDEEKQTVAQKIMFNRLCEVFAEMKNKQKDGKRFVFERFLRKWREAMVTEHSDGFVEHRTDDTFFPAMRLFVPSKDQSRNFQIREAKLNVLVAGALNVQKLDKKYEDRKEVLIDKLVTKSSEYFHVETPKLSIAEVNECLDRIKPDIKKPDEEKAMNKLCRHCTTKELHWIFHIILGDIERELGNLSAHTLMEWFHPGSDSLWKEGNSLLQICEQFSTEEAAGGVGGVHRDLTGNLLCKPFRPMLLKRLDYNKYCLAKIINCCKRPFYVEVKYDGEHLLVHKYGGINYKYYTRNGNDYTHKMGATNETLLSKRIHPFFRPEVKDCVLDCELLIWDRKKQEFVGKNKRASDGNIYDPKHLDEDFFENHTQFDRSLAVFDVLYFNGHCLLKANLPLKDRLEILGRIFKEEDRSIIFVSPKLSIKNAQDFVNFYTKSMREGEEGIVVKGQNSFYRPGARAEKNGWFKIKPDYGAQSTLDLAVVGVRFENAQLNHIKSFLVAALQNGRDRDDQQLRFRIVAGITSKLKALDYQRLRAALGEKEDLLEERPEWLDKRMEIQQQTNGNDGGGGGGPGSRGGGPGKFDRFVPKENIKIVEVRASGVRNGLLQFPSIVSIRNDKSIDEIDSLKDVYQFDERLRSRPIIANESDPHEANILLNRKKRLNLKLKKEYELVKTNTTEVGRFGRQLEGKKVCVLNANGGVSTQDLQKILIQFGATPIALPNAEMAFAIAMDSKKMTCGSQIKANRVHIVKGEWLLRCKEEKKLLPWKEEDMIHTSPAAPFQLFTIPAQNEEELHRREANTEEEMTSMEEDKEEEESSTAEIRPTEEGMEAEDGPAGNENGRANEGENGSDTDTMAQLAEEAEQEAEKVYNELSALNLNELDCEPVEAGNLFADFIFHLHESIDGSGAGRNSLRHKIEQQNGRISDELTAEVTHVVVGKMRSGQEQPLFEWNEWQKQFNGQFVGANWVDKAIEEEDRYRLPDRIHEFIEY